MPRFEGWGRIPIPVERQEAACGVVNRWAQGAYGHEAGNTLAQALESCGYRSEISGGCLVVTTFPERNAVSCSTG